MQVTSGLFIQVRRRRHHLRKDITWFEQFVSPEERGPSRALHRERGRRLEQLVELLRRASHELDRERNFVGRGPGAELPTRALPRRIFGQRQVLEH